MKYGALFALCALTGIAAAQPETTGAPAVGQVEPNGQWPPPGAQPQPQQLNAPTRATFVSTGETTWDVWIDQQPACATPCTSSPAAPSP